MIHPEGKFSRYWSFVSAFLLIYTATFMVYRLVFIKLTFSYFIFEKLIDGLFIFDMLVNFVSAYHNDNGDLVINRK